VQRTLLMSCDQYSSSDSTSSDTRSDHAHKVCVSVNMQADLVALLLY
jgi:hypothetical protein